MGALCPPHLMLSFSACLVCLPHVSLIQGVWLRKVQIFTQIFFFFFFGEAAHRGVRPPATPVYLLRCPWVCVCVKGVLNKSIKTLCKHHLIHTECHV